MEDQKSYEEFVLGLLFALLADCKLAYPSLTKEFDRDFLRISSAIEQHGIWFALDTMPAFRKHLDQCLSKERLIPSHLLHFGVDKTGGVIPRLFRGLILRVFDRSGALRRDADAEAVRLLRQILGSVRKLRMESSVKARGDTVRDFFRTDMEVKRGTLDWDNHLSFDSTSARDLSFGEIARLPAEDTQLSLAETPVLQTSEKGLLDTLQRVADLLSSELGVFDPYAWRPKHGPGAVSDHRYNEYKYSFSNWPDRLNSVFPDDAFAFANADQVDWDATEVDRQKWARCPPARLLAVPKTLAAPRLIASEPTSLQWCQQVVKDYFYSRVRATRLSSMIDFFDQEKNGQLALEASRDGTHATIDLSSASDRVSCWHVERLFRRLPSLLDALQATRSVWIQQDICKYSPRYYYLRKYSTMGNATTFPVQSILFLAIACASLAYARGTKVNYRLLKDCARSGVRVFGDDIIVPGDCSGTLLELLGTLSMRVNTKKTFEVGNFRESCGVDAFRGHDVTTVSVLDVPKRAGPGSIVSTVDVHHNLCEAGFMLTAQWLQKTAGRICGNTIRFVRHGSGRFGWSDMYGTTPTRMRMRMDRDTHTLQVFCLNPRVREERVQPNTPACLLQFFTEATPIVTSAVSHSGHLGRRPKVGLRLGWAAA